MRRLVFFLSLLMLLLMLAIRSEGAEILFFEQPGSQTIGTLTQYAVSLTNPSQEVQRIYGMEIWQQALRRGISPATTAAVLEEKRRVESLSKTRITLLILEAIGGLGSIAVASGALNDFLATDETRGKIAASFIPAGALILRLATTMVQREAKTQEIPMDRIVPGMVELKPGESQWYVLYGRPGGPVSPLPSPAPVQPVTPPPAPAPPVPIFR